MPHSPKATEPRLMFSQAAASFPALHELGSRWKRNAVQVAGFRRDWGRVRAEGAPSLLGLASSMVVTADMALPRFTLSPLCTVPLPLLSVPNAGETQGQSRGRRKGCSEAESETKQKEKEIGEGQRWSSSHTGQRAPCRWGALGSGARCHRCPSGPLDNHTKVCWLITTCNILSLK